MSQTLGWLVEAITQLVTEGVEAGEFPASADPATVASAVVAVVQGGYVLARAKQDRAAFDAAIEGAVAMLRGWSCQ